MTTNTHETMLARIAQLPQPGLEADLAERGDAFQSAPRKFTLAVNPLHKGFEFSILEWAKELGEVVINREDAVALRDWLNASLAEG